MIRFMPDSWREILLRPVAMAAPDAGVYIEIMAPDLRFVFILVLLALFGILSVRRRASGRSARPALLLAAAVAVAFVPWMATTGNGRYFIATLLAAGPLCLALAWLLPITRGARLATGLILLALQGFAVHESSPWDAWGLGRWDKAPYFQVDLPADLTGQAYTVVTKSTISYSLLAPQFHAESRWMSLANAPTGNTAPDARRAQAFLARSTPGRLILLVPFVPGTQTPQGLPNDEVSAVLDEQLKYHRLSLTQPRSCRFLRSDGLVAMTLRREAQADTRSREQIGFWVCHLTHDGRGGDVEQEAAPARFEAVFRRLEADCPRFFAPGQTGALGLADGEVRTYPQSEMKVYVMDGGDVFYKYYRAFNPVKVGSIAGILAGTSKVDCSNIRGRTGLPWERQI